MKKVGLRETEARPGRPCWDWICGLEYMSNTRKTPISTGFDERRRAVVGQDLRNVQVGHLPKAIQVDRKPGRFIDVGDGIFERIARQKQAGPKGGAPCHQGEHFKAGAGQ
jgi:hypothetical protein